MKRYVVTGKKYLSKEEYQSLLQKGDYTHIQKPDERTLTCVTAEELEYDNPWIYISCSFENERDAIKYADEIVNTGIEGSKVEVEKEINFLWIHTRVPVYIANSRKKK